MVMPRQPKSAAEVIQNQEPASSAEIELMEAVQLVQSGQNPMEGIMRIRTLLEADSTFVEAHLWLGAFSLQSGQIDKAVDRFNTVKRLNPQHPEPYWQIGMMAIDNEDYRSAIGQLEKAVVLDSAYVNGLFFMARCYEELAMPDSALHYYETYLPYAPDTVVSGRVNDFIEALKKEINP
jgi:tetratricopeptide (TPR) repeat protein